MPHGHSRPIPLDQTSEQIEALRAEISVIQARLASQESERDTLQDALQEAEVQIGELDRQLGALSQERHALKQELKALDAEGEQLRDAQRQRTDTIDASIQQLWVLQQGGGFRVWLGDQNPEDVARNLAYFEALIEAQSFADFDRGAVLALTLPLPLTHTRDLTLTLTLALPQAPC